MQKNLVTGKEITRAPPWEFKLPPKSMTFDDVRYGIFGSWVETPESGSKLPHSKERKVACNL